VKTFTETEEEAARPLVERIASVRMPQTAPLNVKEAYRVQER